jgi:hypothetical protein
VDDPVVLALREALKKSDSAELRAALGARLLEEGEVASALEQYEAALRLAPAHAPALEGAAKAARQAGDAGKATAYELARAAAAAAGREPGRRAPRRPPRGGRADGGEEEGGGGGGRGGPAAEAGGAGRAAADRGRGPRGSASTTWAARTRSRSGSPAPFLQPLRNPELHKRFGKRIGGGLVLYGPRAAARPSSPRAVAGRDRRALRERGPVRRAGHVVRRERAAPARDLRERARAAPTLLFFDEVDALGQRRTQLKGMAGARW